jgi:hypothetical protein
MVQPASKRLVTEARLGAANGAAPLDGGGKIPSTHVPDLSALYQKAGYLPRPGAFTGLMAALDAGLRSTGVQVIGDSTGVPTWQWVYLTSSWLAARYPALTFQVLPWNATSQDYDAPAIQQTGAAGERYALFTGPGSGQTAFITDSPETSITGDLDIRVKVSMDSWTPAATQVFVCKFSGGGGQYSFRFYVSNNYSNYPRFEWSTDGTALKGAAPTTWTVPAAGATKFLRVTLAVATGTVTFYESTNDGGTWTQIGSPVVVSGGNIFDSTSPLQLASQGGYPGIGSYLAGKIYRVGVRNGINGPHVAPVLPELWETQYAMQFGGAPVCTFVNGSNSGATIAYLADTTRFKMMTPDWGQVAGVFSCSHNDAARLGLSYLADWDSVLSQFRARLPLAQPAIFTQNPRTAPAANITEHALRQSQLLTWAAKNGLSAIDHYRAFLQDPRPLNTLVNPADGVHPLQPDGAQLMADTVTTALINRG